MNIYAISLTFKPLYLRKTTLGGKMKQIHYHEYKEIYDNQFLDVQMEDIEVEMEDYTFLKNKLYSVTFRNVILKGQMEKNNSYIKIGCNFFI